MIFEVVSSALMGGLAIKAQMSKSGLGNDSKKLQKIFTLSGLNVKDGKETLTTQLIKKRNYDWGTEYRYRIPLGRSFEDYLAKQKTIEAGINTRKVNIQFKDLRELKLDKQIISNIKELRTKTLSENKEVELSYDGLLIIRVYDKPMTKKVEFKASKGWNVFLGVEREQNKLIYHSFEDVPHMIEGGATRYGKSTLIHCIMNSLIIQQPNHVHFHLIDLKGGVELSDYENLTQTVSIAYEPEEAEKTLEDAYNSMREMQKRLRKLGKKNVKQAGIPERHFIIIDEVGELNPDEAVDSDEKKLKIKCQQYMSKIARLGAGLGFRLILATQYPTGDVIPRQCKQNSDAKICFRVQSGTASRVVLDGDGAENLPEIKGRAIFQKADKRVIIQTPLIEMKTIQENIQPHIVDKGGQVIAEPEQTTRSNTVVIEKTGLS